MTFGNKRRSHGHVRMSVVVVLALVAGLLATALFWSRNDGQSGGQREPLSVDAPDSSPPSAAPPLDAPSGASSPSTPPTAQPRPAAKSRFTVAIAPRVLETTDRTATLAFQSIYMALVDELRSVPN